VQVALGRAQVFVAREHPHCVDAYVAAYELRAESVAQSADPESTVKPGLVLNRTEREPHACREQVSHR
jgi:hypothetical protein